MAPVTDSVVQNYVNEPVKFSALEVIDLAAEGAAVTEPYRNRVMSQVNDSCLRLAVFEEAYRWHCHPRPPTRAAPYSPSTRHLLRTTVRALPCEA